VSRVRRQASTRRVTTRNIVTSREFALGLQEVRKGLPFNPDNDDWNYERGRCFGFIAPLDMPLQISGRLNNKALRLAEAAYQQKAADMKARRNQLDQLASKLRSALCRETKNIIEIGELLLKSRKLLEHGEWQHWLQEHFDLSYRSAVNYYKAAEYAASKSKSATVSHLAPAVLYALAAGTTYNEQEASAILAASRKGRVDADRASVICQKLRIAAAEDDDDAEDADAEPDAESEAILGGQPPAVPPPAPITTPNLALINFDHAVKALKQLMTKPTAQFVGTAHSADDLQGIESFIHMVADAMKKTAQPEQHEAEGKS
jgi:hypothetical protein